MRAVWIDKGTDADYPRLKAAGGLIQAVRAQVENAHVRLAPECYDGSMNEYDSRGVVKDLTDYGFPYRMISPFYDAAKLRRGWDGFTQARLP